MQLKITHTLTKQNRVLKRKKTKITKCSMPRYTILGFHIGMNLAKESVLSFLCFVQLDHMFKNKGSRVTAVVLLCLNMHEQSKEFLKDSS